MMGNTLPLADQVYILQSNVIKELAEKGPCIILGRCGDYVLRDRPNVLRTFVFAPLEQRIAFAKCRPGAKDMADRLWETALAKHDRARASYYNYYTENRWGEAKNYDLCLNAALGREPAPKSLWTPPPRWKRPPLPSDREPHPHALPCTPVSRLLHETTKDNPLPRRCRVCRSAGERVVFSLYIRGCGN